MITSSMLCPCPEHKPHKGQDHCVCFVPCCNLFRPGLAHNRCVIKLLNDKQNEGLGWKEETVKLPKENGRMGSTARFPDAQVSACSRLPTHVSHPLEELLRGPFKRHSLQTLSNDSTATAQKETCCCYFLL